jgi:cytochrome P450
VLLGAANRDPRRFAAPGRFVPGGAPNPHVSSGAWHFRGLESLPVEA